MFVNIRTRTQVERQVRAGITLDADPMRIGGDTVQPTYIEVTYRFDSLTFQQDNEVTVTGMVMRRNGTVSLRDVPMTWPEGHADMPEWAVRFLCDHKPNPPELLP